MRSLLPLLLLLTLHAHAQDDALQALNVHFSGSVAFSIDRQDRLVAELSDAGGLYRRDMAYIEHLDTAAFAYDAEENVVMVRCASEHAKCIDKEVLKSGVVAPTGRMSLPVPAGDPAGVKALRLLVDLVRTEQAALSDNGGGTKRAKRR